MNGSVRVLDVEQWGSKSSMMTRLQGYRYEEVIHKGYPQGVGLAQDYAQCCAVFD
jgi:hypothetical protein